MKGIFWSNPNDNIKILETSVEAMEKYGLNHGHDVIKLSKEHLEALKAGKMLGWNDSEYSTFLVLDRKIVDKPAEKT